MKRSPNALPALGVGVLTFAISTVSLSLPAAANGTSTALIAAGAAAIVGTLFVDSSNHKHYYVRNNQRHYVSDDQARYYNNHHHNRGQRPAPHQAMMHHDQGHDGHGGADRHDNHR